MDTDSLRTFEDVPLSTTHSHLDGDWMFDQSAQLASCSLCRRILSPDNESIDEHECLTLCGDCKFLFLEDDGTSKQESYQRAPPRGSRARYSSSESVENLFSHQFWHMINLARENQSVISGHEDQSFDGDAGTRFFQSSGSRTIPSESRRWRWIISDAEESELSASFSHYSVFHGESDAVSFSAYGGDSVHLWIELVSCIQKCLFNQKMEAFLIVTLILIQ